MSVSLCVPATGSKSPDKGAHTKRSALATVTASSSYATSFARGLFVYNSSRACANRFYASSRS